MEQQKITRGRKPVADPKVSFRVYVNKSILTKLGGYVAAQNDVIDYMLKKAKRSKINGH